MPVQVLIVDDDPMLQRLLGAHLNTAGYQVVEASNGTAGLAVLRNTGPRIAFVDYDMPGMNGIEFCRQVRADSHIPFTHLVILTAHVDRALTIAALDAGANDFMTKPFHRGELLARLRAGVRTVNLNDRAAQAAGLESERNQINNSMMAVRQLVSAVAVSPKKWETTLARTPQAIQSLCSAIRNLACGAESDAAAGSAWSSFALQPLCAAAITQIGAVINDISIAVKLKMDPPGVQLSGDREAIRCLIINLLHNSAKHTLAGCIDLAVREFCKDGQDWIELKVTDTGCGMEPEVLGQLASSVSLATLAGGQSIGPNGLGIPLCKRIVETHGGHMKINSTPNQGTCVAVVLRANLSGPVEIESNTTAASAAPPIATQL